MMGLAQGNQIANLFVKIGADARQFESAMTGVERRLGVSGGALTKFGAIAAGVVVGGVAALGVGISGAIRSGMEFEKVMSGAGAVLGATGDQMNQLNDLALQLGKDTSFSASQAASAIEMLAKNGVNADQILGGMANATVALAAATGANLATAADVATDAMMQFGLSTDQVSSAINGISGVVVNSKFDINDYALALSQGGGVAAKVGVSFEDFNTTIAAISSAFGSGSDAGTSFKVFLQRLVPQSKPAAATMEKLGLLAADGSNAFFDAAGNMKSMADIAGILQNAFGGLSDAARIEALSEIFGTDAMRAAATLAEVGTQRFNEIADAMSKVDAASQAAKRLDNLAGDVEQLGGSYDTLKIKAEKAFDPLLRKGVQALTSKLNELIDLDFDHFAEMAQRGLDAIGGTVRFVQSGISGLLKGFQKIRGSVGGLLRPFAGPLQDLITQFKTGLSLGFDKTNFSGPLTAIFTGLVDLWVKVERWMLGTGLPALLTTLGQWGAALIEWIAPHVPGILRELASMMGDLLTWFGSVGLPGISAKLQEWGAALWAWIGPQIPPFLRTMGELLGRFGEWASTTALPAITQKTMEWGKALWGWVQPQIGVLLGKLGELWGSVTSWVTDGEKHTALLGKLGEWGGAFLDWAGGLWENSIKPGVGAAWGRLTSWVTDGKRRNELLQNIQDKWTGFQDWAAGAWGVVEPKLAELMRDVNDWIDKNNPDLASWRDSFSTFFENVIEQFKTQSPFIEKRWTEFGNKMTEELDRIGKAFGGTFGPGGSVAWFGKFFANVMVGIGNIFLTLIESMVIKLRVLAESFKAMWEIGKALSKGDAAGVLAGLSQLKDAIGGFSDIWDLWRRTIGTIPDIFNALPNGEPTPPPGGWFSGEPIPPAGGWFGGNSQGSGNIINVNVNPDTIPTDRTKLQELARAIFREVEISGARF